MHGPPQETFLSWLVHESQSKTNCSLIDANIYLLHALQTQVFPCPRRKLVPQKAVISSSCDMSLTATIICLHVPDIFITLNSADGSHE